MTKLTLVPKKHYCKLIGRKKFYWPLETFTQQEAQLEAMHLLADWARFQIEGHEAWPAGPSHRLLLQQKLCIGPFKPLLNSLPMSPISMATATEIKPHQSTIAPQVKPSMTTAIGQHMTFTDLVNLFLTEALDMTDKKKKDLRNRLKVAQSVFNGSPIGTYSREKYIEVAKRINGRDLSDLYKRDIFQALYRVFTFAGGRENLELKVPGNLKEIFTPKKTVKTAEDVWETEEGKYWSKEDIKVALTHATGPMRAFILLGLNCGYGTSEIGVLEKSHLKNGGTVIQTIRGKTAKNVRPAKLQHKLWKETAEAIKASMTAEGKYVWSTTKGETVSANDYVGKLYRAFCKENNLTLPNFKLLRKTSANEVQKNSNSDIASLHLGHSTKTVTQAFYTEANWKALDAATDKMRADFKDCF